MLSSRSVPQCKEATSIRTVHVGEWTQLTPHAAGSPESAMPEAMCRLITIRATNNPNVFIFRRVKSRGE
jgi:hypothetical protein